jgi:hypothetical protein
MTDQIKGAGGVERCEQCGEGICTGEHRLTIAALLEVVKAYRHQHDVKLDCNLQTYGINVGDHLPRIEEIDDGRCELCRRADQLLKEVEG